jgi:hypothetical protein
LIGRDTVSSHDCPAFRAKVVSKSPYRDDERAEFNFGQITVGQITVGADNSGTWPHPAVRRVFFCFASAATDRRSADTSITPWTGAAHRVAAG